MKQNATSNYIIAQFRLKETFGNMREVNFVMRRIAMLLNKKSFFNGGNRSLFDVINSYKEAFAAGDKFAGEIAIDGKTFKELTGTDYMKLSGQKRNDYIKYKLSDPNIYEAIISKLLPGLDQQTGEYQRSSDDTIKDQFQKSFKK